MTIGLLWWLTTVFTGWCCYRVGHEAGRRQLAREIRERERKIHAHIHALITRAQQQQHRRMN